MNTIIRNALAAVVVATAGIAASAPAATAGGVGFELSIGGHGGGIVVRDRGHRNVCKPRRAVQKARHMGIRRADVVRANNRRVVVRGVRHHRQVRVVFANQRSCPVIRIRR